MLVSYTNIRHTAKMVTDALIERLDSHDKNRKEVQEQLHNMCEMWRKEIDDLEDRINSELETKFKEEDSRLQTALNDLQTADKESFSEAFQKAKAELAVLQRYDLKEIEDDEITNFFNTLGLSVEKSVDPEWLDKPRNPKVNKIDNGKVFLSFTFFNHLERVLTDNGLKDTISYKAFLQKKGEGGGKEYTLRRDEDCFSFAPDFIGAETTYTVKVKTELQEKQSEWSEEAEFIPMLSEFCAWKRCPDSVNWTRKYSVDEENPRITIKTGSDKLCTIIGNTFLPPNKVTSWGIKTLKSERNDGEGIFIGVAPSDINQNEDNYEEYGWYFNCYNSTLWSGPPHSYNYKDYGPRKGDGEYVHTGDSVGVVMDTTKGELSFIVNGVNLGVAYNGIPLDKPLVPCVLFMYIGDSVELIN